MRTTPVALIMNGLALTFGHYLFFACAAAFVAAVAVVIAVTVKKRRPKTVKGAPPAADDYFESALPPSPVGYSFVKYMGFDPYVAPAPESTYVPAAHLSDEVNELLANWYDTYRTQEVYRREMAGLNNLHNRTADNLGFLKYLLQECEARVRELREEGEKEDEGALAVVNALSARVRVREEEYKAHAQQIWAAVESLRTRIISNDAELYNLKTELEDLRKKSDGDTEELEKAVRQFDSSMRFEALIPLLHAVNRAFNESESAQEKIRLAEAKLNFYREKTEALKTTVHGADTKEEEDRLAVAAELYGAVIGACIAHRKTLADEYQIHKKAADEYLKGQRLSVDEIVKTEDRVIGQIEYESVRREMLFRQETAAKTLAAAEREYAAVSGGRRGIKTKDGQQKTEREMRTEAAAMALKQARAEKAAADEAVETVLPTLDAITLIKSGSGVISQELLARLQGSKQLSFNGYFDAVYAAAEAYRTNGEIIYTLLPQDYFDLSAEAEREEQEQKELEKRNINELYPLKSALIAERLDELIKQSERTADPEAEKAKAKPTSSSPESAEIIEKVNKRIAEIMRLRREMKYIDTEKESKAFLSKLNSIVKTFDSDEKRNVALTELVKRTRAMAGYFGGKRKKDAKADADGTANEA